ncbi:hypothetical protein T4B_5270 [Trichinella pseudospiralis]|uniref:Uncharacterized protein n=1 Tax=Trichinella pseudospiralis TaxID=6337 RepID=A0A0V1HVA9_TRIPS|nr:hypothetical protein T4B_5270 [Trichinella pseudospiralis]
MHRKASEDRLAACLSDPVTFLAEQRKIIRILVVLVVLDAVFGAFNFGHHLVSDVFTFIRFHPRVPSSRY